MFLNTLAIDEERVRTILKNITETGAIKVDGRGRHGNHKTAEVIEELVMQHIQQFKVLESHYVHRNAKFEYLPVELSISEMYRMYLERRVEKSYPLENYHFYSRVFHERFNLKFQKPKKDICDNVKLLKMQMKRMLQQKRS